MGIELADDVPGARAETHRRKTDPVREISAQGRRSMSKHSGCYVEVDRYA